MKKLFFFTLVLFTAAFFSESLKAQTEAQKIELCSRVANATMVNNYVVQLPAAREGERAQDFKQAFGLRAGNKYRITICTDEESDGEAYVRLMDAGKLVGTSYDTQTGRTVQSFDFDCTKTAAYVIIVAIKDGKEGAAVIIVSLLTK